MSSNVWYVSPYTENGAASKKKNTKDYHPGNSSSDNWLWKASKVGFILKVHTICQNNAYRNQLFLMDLHQNLTHP